MAAPEPDGSVCGVRVLRELGRGLRQAFLELLAILLGYLGGEERLAEERSRLGLAVLRDGARAKVAVVPGEVALVAVLPVARGLDRVPLIRVHHELRVHATRSAQGLVHLLRGEERHVDVDRTAEEESRRRHLLHVEERGQAQPVVPRLPGESQLHLPLVLVVVRPVAGEVVGHGGARDGGLEAPRLRDHHVGEDAAIAPAAHAEAVGIRHAHSHDVVGCRHDVLEVLVSPVRPDRAAVGGAPAGGAPWVRGDHGIAARGEDLPLELEGGRELVGGPAVDPEDGRQPLAANVARGQRQESVHRGAVSARGLESLDTAERERLQQLVVRAGEAAQAASGDGRDLRRLVGRACRARRRRRWGPRRTPARRARPRRGARRCRPRRSPGRGGGGRGPPGGRAPARPSGVNLGGCDVAVEGGGERPRRPPSTGASATDSCRTRGPSGRTPAT